MFSKVLVANRGEIARRVFRTCRELGIGTVAVYSTVDRDQPHVGDADHSVHLPGSTPSETYLNIASLIAAAKESGADAVHPGYGFLSENPDFAVAVVAAGLTWIGPEPESIKLMASKIASKRLMEDHDVPVLPSIVITDDLDLETAAAEIGFPVLVKASAGGGGKGMKVVDNPELLDEAVASAQREAIAAFGDGTLFLEKYLESPRHIEVQVFGDSHGTVVSMYERECSIQRRHQKIIEEAPAPNLDEGLRQRLHEAAEAAARAVDYVGAGTVEFLVERDRFYFLEMNTRLQVEHPVTEMITGIDLVKLQIDVAAGGRIEPPKAVTGHAIEARLYAEDPENGFLPMTGTVDRIAFDPGVRVDSGVESGTEISIHYDPMIAKVIAHGNDRESAIRHLATSLRTAQIHGPTTNRDLLIAVLEHPTFGEGRTTTRFLDEFELILGHDQETERRAATAATVADVAEISATTAIPPGWRNLPDAGRQRTYRSRRHDHSINYRGDRFGIALDGAEVVEAKPDRVSIRFGTNLERFQVWRYGAVRYVGFDQGEVRLEIAPRFTPRSLESATGGLHAPMPGAILRVDVAVGDLVEEGQTLIVMEAMKMEHTLRAPQSGTVTELRCAVGDQVETGSILAVVEEP